MGNLCHTAFKIIYILIQVNKHKDAYRDGIKRDGDKIVMGYNITHGSQNYFHIECSDIPMAQSLYCHLVYISHALCLLHSTLSCVG